MGQINCFGLKNATIKSYTGLWENLFFFFSLMKPGFFFIQINCFRKSYVWRGMWQ